MGTSSEYTQAQADTDESNAPVRFTDWRGGEAVTKKTDDETKRRQLRQRTLSLGNQTEIGFDKGNLPSGSEWIKGKSLYERLDLHNRDCWRYWRDDVEISVSVDNGYKRTLVAAFCGELEMNQHQRQRAFKQLMELNLPKTGVLVPLTAFVICALIVNNDAAAYSDDNKYHPQRAARNNDPHFLRLEESLINAHPQITKKLMTSVYNKLGQADPEVRPRSQWGGFVRQQSFVPVTPSYVTGEFDPEDVAA